MYAMTSLVRTGLFQPNRCMRTNKNDFARLYDDGSKGCSATKNEGVDEIGELLCLLV